MKAIFEDNVRMHISSLCGKFYPMKMDKEKINALLKFYRPSTDKVSDEKMEKIIACIYALQTRGIPLKASSTVLGIDTAKTLRLFKKLRKPSIKYIPLFIDLLKAEYSDVTKQQFDYIFKKIAPNVEDHFALATVLNLELKKSNSYYGYSEVTIIRYRKLIREERLNGQ